MEINGKIKYDIALYSEPLYMGQAYFMQLQDNLSRSSGIQLPLKLVRVGIMDLAANDHI